MEPHVFHNLAKSLKEKYELKSTRSMQYKEVLGIFVYLCAEFQYSRNMQNESKHSVETISRKFNEVLEAITRFSRDIVRPYLLTLGEFHQKFEIIINISHILKIALVPLMVLISHT